MFRGPLTRRIIFFSLTWLFLTIPVSVAFAGSYLDSAHGSGSDGVFRPTIGNTPPSGFGYSKGNCAHCHEQHSSIAGTEPVPATGAAPYELFAKNFNTSVKTSPYAEADNFCFYCHNDPTSAQIVLNYDYSRNFGCAINGPTTILSTMNRVSYHNLWDVWDYSKNNFTWFTDSSNPCDACHNPHIARRNWANPADPSFSAISKPDDHFNPLVWGSSDTMDSSYNTKYQAPFCSGSLYEPASSSDAAISRASTPDYVAFCTTCHTTTPSTVFSTTLNRNLEPIDWSSTGDKHGLRLMDGSVSTKAPFDTPSSGTNFVLSCLDCHEPHGSENIMLLRRRANGSDLTSTITSFTNNEWGLLCLKCHVDDEAAGIGTANQWESVHHLVSDAPYSQRQCGFCHSNGGGGSPLPCLDCHFHGGTATKADKNGVYRIGF